MNAVKETAPLWALSLLVGTCTLSCSDRIDSYCDQYLECVAAVQPSMHTEALTRYGASSDCWRSNGAAESCAVICKNNLQALFVEFGQNEACRVSSTPSDAAIVSSDAAIETADGPSWNDAGTRNDAQSTQEDAIDCPDSDHDTICDDADVAPGLDDRVDIDGNGVADPTETIFANSQFRESLGSEWHQAHSNSKSADWILNDDGNSSYSGSVSILTSRTADSAAPDFACVKQCVGVKESTEYHLATRYFINGRGPYDAGEAVLIYFEYNDTDCLGPAKAPELHALGTVQQSWTTGTLLFTTQEETESAVFLFCSLMPANTGSGILHVRFDNMLLRQQ